REILGADVRRHHETHDVAAAPGILILPNGRGHRHAARAQVVAADVAGESGERQVSGKLEGTADLGLGDEVVWIATQLEVGILLEHLVHLLLGHLGPPTRSLARSPFNMAVTKPTCRRRSARPGRTLRSGSARCRPSRRTDSPATAPWRGTAATG